MENINLNLFFLGFSIISPMRKNITIPFSSDSEDEIVLKNRKKNGIIEQYSSLENKNSNNNGEKIDASYNQKVRKIKRNSEKIYCIQTGNIVRKKEYL